jgi:hypothetical protein
MKFSPCFSRGAVVFGFAVLSIGLSSIHARADQVTDADEGERTQQVGDYMYRNLLSSFDLVQTGLAATPPRTCSNEAEPSSKSPSNNPMASFDAALQGPSKKAVSPEVGMGYTKYNLTQDGIWYDSTFPHDVQLTPPEMSFGVRAKITDAVSVRAGAEYLGQVTSAAIAVGSDASYAVCKNNHSLCLPVSHWYGFGGVSELYLTVDGEKKIMGVPVIAEAGVAVNRPTWEENVPDAYQTPSGPHNVYLSVSHDPRLQFGYRAGFGVRLSKDTTLMLDWQTTSAKGDQYPAIYSGPAYTIEYRKDF